MVTCLIRIVLHANLFAVMLHFLSSLQYMYVKF